MNFSAYLRGALVGALFTGLALALLFLALVVAGLRIEGDITLNLEVGLSDGFWLLLILPVTLSFLTLVVSPLAFLLLLPLRKIRERGARDSAAREETTR